MRWRRRRRCWRCRCRWRQRPPCRRRGGLGGGGGGGPAAGAGRLGAATAARAPAWDVFLTYARADAERATALADALRKHGLGVFLDREHLQPGEIWTRALERSAHRPHHAGSALPGLRDRPNPA
ncbi:MAG: toll/interleukin-1 receptor domain-containing protein [Myxococcales bacterium]|nr:toll/interleukin-1 receptor domain-containing protein [Myxococcales bacterium]